LLRRKIEQANLHDRGIFIMPASRRPFRPRRLSCGVVVTDGTHILLGHAARSRFWDIPKGVAEEDEEPLLAAVRELREETGLIVDSAALQPLGRHEYLRDKDLELFGWRTDTMPDPARLQCSTFIRLPDGARLPELDRFRIVPVAEGLQMVGRNLSRVLSAIWSQFVI